MLAARVLMEQGVEVTALSFKSCFFSTAKARKAAEELGINFIEVDFSDEHLNMVKNPAHGYGKNMNPCIDCHSLMLKKAKEVMERDGFDLVATGEVLGQRPMSQNREALKMVEVTSGLVGRLLRPMSAKLMDETEAEKKGLINRRRLLDISGRSRSPQLELVKKYKIKEYSSPAGGCLLTDQEFSEKLLKLLEFWPDCGAGDAELLKHGRIVWLKNETSKNILMVIGRDQKDNEQLEKLAIKNDIIMEMAEENGPTSLLRGIGSSELEVTEREVKVPKEIKLSELKLGEEKSEEEIIKTALMLILYYAPKVRDKKVKMIIKLI